MPFFDFEIPGDTTSRNQLSKPLLLTSIVPKNTWEKELPSWPEDLPAKLLANSW